MIQIVSAANLSARVYLKSGRVALPSLLLLCVIGVLYTIQPVDTVGSFSISAMMVCFVSLALALSCGWSEEGAWSQILSVQCGATGCALAQSLYVCLLAVTAGSLAVLYPLMYGLCSDTFFATPPTALDALGGWVANASLALVGATLGSLFHPGLVADRKFAYLGAILAALLGLAYHFAGLPAWVGLPLPPVYDALSPVARSGAFDALSIAHCAARSVLFAASAIALRTFMLARKAHGRMVFFE